jgi:phenylpyruvate tautomerase PptA (4-oxalocrotonate tautomerase family)
MPLYTVVAENGSISDAKRRRIAMEITRIHTEVMKVPKSYVHVVFLTYARGCGYTAGVKSPTVFVICILRFGHTVDDKRDMLQQLWAMFQQTAGLATEQLAISLQEIAASNAMELGKIMPDVVQA